MRIIRSVKIMSDLSKKMRLQRKSIGFVPTMGSLHEGHLSLLRRARRENDIAVVSIFVNPAQFGPKEDLKRYPRNLKRDSRLCRKERADVLFSPDAKEMYPHNYQAYINLQDLDSCLCARFRPGHFRGVATVVAKLFNIIDPDRAYFGQKDFQQAFVIRKMVQDLNMPVKIQMMPTVRESDGLAMSSRNAYLDKNQRQEAAVLYQALIMAKGLIRQGKIESSWIIRKMKKLINKRKNAKIQYIEIVDQASLRPVSKIKGSVLVALAVFIGKTRLIDNIIIRV
jgi:pantoate--beta-alanine ligase